MRDLRAKAFSRWLGRDFGSWGSDSVIYPPCEYGHSSNVFVGDRVWIGPNCNLTSTLSGRIEIGHDCHIVGDLVVFSAIRVTLEPGVLIARHVHIVDGNHRSSDPSIPILSQGMDRLAPVTVGEGSWIGAGVVIHAGVTIGRNAVIGSNAVVRSDVPDHGVAVGIPARVLDAASHEYRDEQRLSVLARN